MTGRAARRRLGPPARRPEGTGLPSPRHDPVAGLNAVTFSRKALGIPPRLCPGTEPRRPRRPPRSTHSLPLRRRLGDGRVGKQEFFDLERRDVLPFGAWASGMEAGQLHPHRAVQGRCRCRCRRATGDYRRAGSFPPAMLTLVRVSIGSRSPAANTRERLPSYGLLRSRDCVLILRQNRHAREGGTLSA